MTTEKPNFSWVEELPENCPPDNSLSPEGLDFYRLVNSDPPTHDDFLPTQGWSRRPFNISECIGKSVSLFTNTHRLKEIQKLPTHRHQVIARVLLYQKDGLISQTFSDETHYSWWRSNAFDPSQTEII